MAIAPIAAMPEANAKRRRPPSIAARLRFERRPRRVLRPRVLVALVLAERLLDVGRGLVDRRDDRAGRRIGLLAGVNADRAETRARRELHRVQSRYVLIRDRSDGRLATPRRDRRLQPIGRRRPLAAASHAAGPRGRHRPSSLQIGVAVCSRGGRRRSSDARRSSARLGALALAVGSATSSVRLIVLAKRRLLWRVRRS